ncbi:S-adenosylmethionine decarboxylase [Plesiocystis pacifica SIR-1]|uniref:S-adenosylmethionine decarboxylase n=1 Tax=Plesiocystis pacifica SIR-1 TaxID=391625 RepID=A6G5J8_9BACT|nr:hypothetical protein [Plesiocystis pacifica]EDM78779.1 S-adenosylmethionine decarboxylase [Plesiocystis pacifica SIR-1]
MPLPEVFAEESLYTPDQWYVHDLLELGEERVVAVCETERLVDNPVVVAQRPWPGQPKHVPGIIMVQITGTLGNIHAVCSLGLRMSEGWVGFGTNIHQARYRGMGTLGPPLICTMEIERLRRIGGGIFITYTYDFRQEGRRIYSSRQSASWSRPVEA